MKISLLSKANLKVFPAMAKWRDACTVIVTVPSSTKHQVQRTKHDEENATTEADFNVLMLKRSSKSSFFPNAYVFPGGNIDKVSPLKEVCLVAVRQMTICSTAGKLYCSSQWIKVFESVDPKFVGLFKKLKVNQTDGRRSPMFLQSSSDTLLKEVAYRICAIRETFEETGVLMTRRNSSKLGASAVELVDDVYEFKNLEESRLWRKRVHDDASQFVQLFDNLKCVPDIWALHEWSNWLTPTEMFMKMSKRFDTVFYTASLPRVPSHSEQDNKETVHMIFNTASDILETCKPGNIYVGPPQLVELTRVAKFCNHRHFTQFTAKRSLKGMERCLPLRTVTADGVMLSIYPGDQWYPEERVASGDKSSFEIPMTYDEMMKVEPKHHNHICYRLPPKFCSFMYSCTPRYGHISPAPFKFLIKHVQKL